MSIHVTYSGHNADCNQELRAARAKKNYVLMTIADTAASDIAQKDWNCAKRQLKEMVKRSLLASISTEKLLCRMFLLGSTAILFNFLLTDFCHQTFSFYRMSCC